jgi:hypothetical protein
MSIPAPPGAPGSVHPTRRQLEELEVLIQHMLTLPVNPAEMPATVTAEKITLVNGADQPARGLADSLPESPPEQAPSAGPPPRQVSMDSLIPDLAEKLVLLEQAAPEPEKSARLLTKVWERLNAVPALVDQGGRLPAGLLGVLVWTDRGFDRLMGWLGPPGRWLRGPWGRALIGWTGMALLAAAAVWGVLGLCRWTW